MIRKKEKKEKEVGRKVKEKKSKIKQWGEEDQEVDGRNR